MDVEAIRLYFLSKKAASEGTPFGDDVLVFKVLDKMFGTLSLTGEARINLKCDPETAIELREQYDCVLPGYHMSKKHWNTIADLEMVADELLIEWIDHSYEMVVKGMKKSVREFLQSE